MATVKVTEPAYLVAVGYKTPEDGEFEYTGPAHHCLVTPQGGEYKPKADIK